MLPEISEIRAFRRRLGLTQTELSKLCGVSQSLIAKMESKQIVPSYEKAKRIFEALEQAGRRKSSRAKEIMSRRVRSVREADTVRKAVSLMEKNAFSQVPVIRRDKCIGVVTERGALSALRELDPKEFNSLTAADIREECPPIVNEQTLFPVLAGILNHEQAVLVSKKGKITGIITKSDLLKSALVRQT